MHLEIEKWVQERESKMTNAKRQKRYRVRKEQELGL